MTAMHLRYIAWQGVLHMSLICTRWVRRHTPEGIVISPPLLHNPPPPGGAAQLCSVDGTKIMQDKRKTSRLLMTHPPSNRGVRSRTTTTSPHGVVQDSYRSEPYSLSKQARQDNLNNLKTTSTNDTEITHRGEGHVQHGQPPTRRPGKTTAKPRWNEGLQ